MADTEENPVPSEAITVRVRGDGAEEMFFKVLLSLICSNPSDIHTLLSFRSRKVQRCPRFLTLTPGVEASM